MFSSSSLAVLTTIFLGFFALAGLGQEKKASPGAQAEEPALLFASRNAGALFAPITGSWRFYDNEGINIIRLTPQPVRECRLEMGPKLRGPGYSISAKTQAKAKSRLFPKMGVGLYGANGLCLLLAPGHQRLELVQYGETIAQDPLTAWKEEIWWTLELRVTPQDRHGKIEARAWPSDAPRPEKAALEREMALEMLPLPLSGRAFVTASPYSGLPVYFDEVVVLKIP